MEEKTVYIGESFRLSAPGNFQWTCTIIGTSAIIHVSDEQGSYDDVAQATNWSFHADTLGTVEVRFTGQPRFTGGAARSHMVVLHSYIVHVIA